MAKRTLLAHAEKLQALRVLFATRSFRQAAATLNITSSALSQAITALEAHLGQPLAIRSPKGVVPTPWAAQLLAAASPALDTIISLGESEQTSLPRTKLRLGAYESIAVYAVPELLARLGARHPMLRVTIRTGRSGLLLKLVRRGELDVALVGEGAPMDRLDVDVLATDQLALWASPLHAIFREGVSRTTPYAGLAPGTDGLPRYYRKFLDAGGLSRRPWIECDSFEALRMMAIRHVTPAVLPRRVARRVPGELRAVPLHEQADDAGSHGICLVSRHRTSDRARTILATELRALLAS